MYISISMNYKHIFIELMEELRRKQMTRITVFTKHEIENLLKNKIVTYTDQDGIVHIFMSEERYEKFKEEK